MSLPDAHPTAGIAPEPRQAAAEKAATPATSSPHPEASAGAQRTPYRVLITGSREYGKDLIQPGSKKRWRADWKTAPSPQRDAMVAAFREARIRAGGRPLLVVYGDAAGADTLAATLAELSHCETECWPALWRREDGTLRGGYDRDEALRVRSVYAPGKGYYPKAGPERNQAMVNAGADEMLAFKALGAGNRGTQHCIDAAVAAGIPVTITEA